MIFNLFFLVLLVTGFYLVQGAPQKQYPLEIVFLDVGQGDATLIKLKDQKEFLIDAGPDRKIIEKLGQNLSIKNNVIEGVLITHLHADHITGLNYLLKERAVETIYLAKNEVQSPEARELKSLIESKNIEVKLLNQGDELNFYGAIFRILAPENKFNPSDLNESSVVATLDFGRCRYFFPGDASAKIQNKALGGPLAVDVLKVSHHGSKTATDQELIEKLTPNFAVISVGAKNKYHHPAPSIVSLLSNIPTLRTDQSGDIKFGCDSEKNLLLQ